MLTAKISPSMMCADLAHLEEAMIKINETKPEYLHMDIMDGVFVPNYALSPDLAKTIRKYSDIPFDYHFMVVEPLKKIAWFDLKENDLVSIHLEALPGSTHDKVKSLRDLRDFLHDKGVLLGLAISPDTKVEELSSYLKYIDFALLMMVYPGFAGQKLVEKCLDKIEFLRRYADESGFEKLIIEVDGNVSFENAKKMRKLGADLFVGGSSSFFYKDDSLINNMERLRKTLGE